MNLGKADAEENACPRISQEGTQRPLQLKKAAEFGIIGVSCSAYFEDMQGTIMRLSWRLVLRFHKATGTRKHVTTLASPNRVLVKVAWEAVNTRGSRNKDCLQRRAVGSR